MMAFVLASLILVALALLGLLWPVLRNRAVKTVSHQEVNAAIYRRQLAQLDEDRIQGRIDVTTYEQDKLELQQRLLEEMGGSPEAESVSAPRLGKVTALVIAGCIPLLALVIYASVGNPSLGLNPEVMQAQSQQQPPMTQQDIENMVSNLAAKLEKEPDNIEGWTMLGRSYLQMQRYADAVKVYERIMPAVQTNPDLLVSYAEALAGAGGNSLKGKPTAVLAQALKIDPQHPMGLWLLGTAAAELGEYKRAIVAWEQLKKLLQPGGEDYALVESAIAEANNRIQAAGK
ncbi:MAG: hypothetical protein RLZZ397_78 [Pseudomonadota bacterium]|jgi:cytochrome c-type biogenesis protein CcmH